MANDSPIMKLPKMAAGQRYGRLVAIEFVERTSRSRSRWLFQCDCGKKCTAFAGTVRIGEKLSCGCSRGGKLLIAAGQRYGRLIAIKCEGHTAKYSAAMWRLRCDCGREHVTRAASVRRGDVRSCGCLRKENGGGAKTHGMTNTPEYNSWQGCRNRCQNSKDVNFRHYGGRGIKVCERWQKFENFFADMGRKPTPKHSLDRINNDGNYEPGNCRWVTQSDQMRNQRKQRAIENFSDIELQAELNRRRSKKRFSGTVIVSDLFAKAKGDSHG